MSVREALEADLTAWRVLDGTLVETARTLASAIDSGASERDLVALARELRLTVDVIRSHVKLAGTSSVEEFLAGITAEEFGGR